MPQAYCALTGLGALRSHCQGRRFACPWLFHFAPLALVSSNRVRPGATRRLPPAFPFRAVGACVFQPRTTRGDASLAPGFSISRRWRLCLPTAYDQGRRVACPWLFISRLWRMNIAAKSIFRKRYARRSGVIGFLPSALKYKGHASPTPASFIFAASSLIPD